MSHRTRLTTPDGWTPQDQARADAFERQIAALQPQLVTDAHPDVIVVSFVQALRNLMIQRLLQDPDVLAPRYADLLVWIADELDATITALGAEVKQ